MPIRKFIRNSADSEHYDYCARHRYPVIVIGNLDAGHCTLFYDITERDGASQPSPPPCTESPKPTPNSTTCPPTSASTSPTNAIISTSPCAANTPNTPPKRCSIICCGNFGQPEKR